jgi:hypothetical protein
MQVVRARPHVGKDQCPKVNDRQAVRINGALGLFGDEVLHHSQKSSG